MIDQPAKEQKQASALPLHLEQRVMTTLEPQDTTDLLLRGQQAALLQDVTFAQVMGLIRIFIIDHIDHVSGE